MTPLGHARIRTRNTARSFTCINNLLGYAQTQNVPDLACLFCSKNETCEHLFFECVVAKMMWEILSNLTSYKKQMDMLGVSGLWI
jgi:hypothetical protein